MVTDQYGQVWSLTATFSDTEVDINYSGPQSGSITVTVSDVTLNAGTRRTQTSRACIVQKQSAADGIERVATAFHVAAIFLGFIGLEPAAVVSAVIGAGLGTYKSFFC